MRIVEVASGDRKAIIIREAEVKDYKIVTKKRFSFAWKTVRNSATVYKIQVEGEDDILGVIGLIDWPDEKRIEIKLLASAIENTGKQKIYEGVAGCLIAFACRMAIRKYGPVACVSLIPKTRLIKHYMERYYMEDGGRQLYLDGNNLGRILKEYYEN